MILRIGVSGLVVGVLIFFAVRASGGGIAGILLLGLITWPLFEGAWAVLRGISRARTRLSSRHTNLAGCMGIILILGAIAFLRSIGWLGLLGMIAGGILTYVNQGGRLVAWSQVVGLAPVPAPAEARPPRVPPPHERWAKLVAGLLCLLAGLVFTGFGTWRFIEANSLVTDSGCTHPCGMVNGLWVQVMPGTHGEVVTRTDAATVRILVRFWDDAPGDRVVSSSDFVLGNSHTAFDHVTSAPGCATWTPHTIRIDEHTDDMTLCFAIAQRDEVDLSQLSLVWTQQAGAVRISLGQAHSTGYLSIGETPSPLHP